LTKHAKCVFPDADTPSIQNCDVPSDCEELSAPSSVGWPNCFNSSVVVFRPNLNIYKELTNLAVIPESFDGANQGLPNIFLIDWARKYIPFTYNMVANTSLSHLSVHKQFGQYVSIAHFYGPTKPWPISFDASGEPSVSSEGKPALSRGTAEMDNTIPTCLASSSMSANYSSNPHPPTTVAPVCTFYGHWLCSSTAGAARQVRISCSHSTLKIFIYQDINTSASSV
jgi:hypothetical protein